MPPRDLFRDLDLRGHTLEGLFLHLDFSSCTVDSTTVFKGKYYRCKFPKNTKIVGEVIG